MAKRGRVYGKPDGTDTKDVEEYINAWYEKGKVIEILTGMKVCAFDPNISFSTKDSPSATITLPLWFIDLFDKRIDHKDAIVEETFDKIKSDIANDSLLRGDLSYHDLNRIMEKTLKKMKGNQEGYHE